MLVAIIHIFGATLVHWDIHWSGQVPAWNFWNLIATQGKFQTGINVTRQLHLGTFDDMVPVWNFWNSIAPG